MIYSSSADMHRSYAKYYAILHNALELLGFYYEAGRCLETEPLKIPRDDCLCSNGGRAFSQGLLEMAVLRISGLES